MYIPIMKNRGEELRVSDTCSDFFSDSIIPMYEIIQDQYNDRYKIDEESGKPEYELKPGNKNRTKIKLEHDENDIITLQDVNQKIGGKRAFIDFFRFTDNEYSNIDFKKVETSFKLSRDFEYYQKRVLQVGDFENFIPTISIKSGLEISEYDLLVLLNQLRRSNQSVAFRITADCLDSYSDFIEKYFRESDYVMLDIRENSKESKALEIEDFIDLEFLGKKILLNSPRKKDIQNGEFENKDFTSKIDNSISTVYRELDFDGFGDFGGLKDDLPKDHMNERGAALALLYFRSNNKFYSVVNVDTSLGVKGYEYVKREVLHNRDFFDPNHTCLGMKKVEQLPGIGNYGSWNNIALTRYIQQRYQN